MPTSPAPAHTGRRAPRLPALALLLGLALLAACDAGDASGPHAGQPAGIPAGQHAAPGSGAAADSRSADGAAAGQPAAPGAGDVAGSPAAGGRLPADLTIVLRTARHLEDPTQIPALVARLVAAGVAHVWLQFKQDETDEVPGGQLFHPSALAPVAAGYEDGRLERLLAALLEAGLAVSAWVPCLNDRTAWEAHPDWRAWRLDETGSPQEQVDWLCPRHPEVVAYEAALVAEIAQRHPGLSGLYTDFIRFDADLSCVCPRCLEALRGRLGERAPAASAPTDAELCRRLPTAAQDDSALWSVWTRLRSDAICKVADALRDALDAARQDIWFGACLLPFSAEDYSFNTQSGQDVSRLARQGLDEIVLMGYWDDWDKSPRWLERSLVAAAEQVGDECELSCLVDGDMSIRRTWLTLDAIEDVPLHALGYFNYWEWSEGALERVRAGHDGAQLGDVPPPAFTAVAVRVDTEPDYENSYDALRPEMITELATLFEEEGTRATFVTCGRLAGLQREALLDVAHRGHEIACHAYDHEQLDALEPEQELASIERGLSAIADLGVPLLGFGAPRNSLTPGGRDRLIEHGLLYDGSAAYDPEVSLIDVERVSHSQAEVPGSILLVPFIMPNDWDALYVAGVDAAEMGALWRRRLDLVADMDEPVFVLDVHQWLEAREDARQALRGLLRHARARSDCRLMTLAEAARHADAHLVAVEEAARAATAARRVSR